MRSWFVCKKPGLEANNSQSAQGNGLNIIHLFKCLTVKSGCYLRLYEASPLNHQCINTYRAGWSIPIQYTYVIFDYSCAMDRKTKCIPMFLFYGFSSCDSSIRSALLYQWPLLLSGGSPSRLRHRSRIEPGTYVHKRCAITVRMFTSEFFTIFRLTWSQGPGLPGFQVLFTNSTIYIFKVFGLLISLYFRADWSVVTQNPAWKWFLEEFFAHTQVALI